MRPPRITAALLLMAGLVLAPPSAAAVNAYLQLGDVKGESKDPAHLGWIEVRSFSWGMNGPQGSGVGGQQDQVKGSTLGRTSHGDLTIVKVRDSSSPALSQGRRFAKVVIDAQGSRWVLTNVIVSSVVPHFSSASGEENPTESVTFEYGALEIAYTPQTRGTPTPSKKSPSAAEVAPPALQAAVAPPKITGASAAAPFMGLTVTVTITSSGPCRDAFVDYGDGSIAEGHVLTSTSTTLGAHTYPSAGAKTIKVGGRDAPYWPPSPPKAPPQKGANPCTGWAPEVHVTLRSDIYNAPAMRSPASVIPVH